MSEKPRRVRSGVYGSGSPLVTTTLTDEARRYNARVQVKIGVSLYDSYEGCRKASSQEARWRTKFHLILAASFVFPVRIRACEIAVQHRAGSHKSARQSVHCCGP